MDMKPENRYKWLPGAILLGLVFFLAVFLVKPVGVSTQFSQTAGMVWSAADPAVARPLPEAGASVYTSSNAYFAKDGGKLAKAVAQPRNYGFLFVLAIPLGAFAAHLWKRKDEPAERFKTSSVSGRLQFLSGFIGGAVMLYGARLAGGCTSGHMFSGMMQGSLSSYFFAAAVFATAVPTAIFVRRLSKGGVDHE